MSSSGALILIVGPSAAGKDLLIRAARRELADEPAIRFARRFITRAPDADEDNIFMTSTGFEAMRARDEFLLS